MFDLNIPYSVCFKLETDIKRKIADEELEIFDQQLEREAEEAERRRLAEIEAMNVRRRRSLQSAGAIVEVEALGVRNNNIDAEAVLLVSCATLANAIKLIEVDVLSLGALSRFSRNKYTLQVIEHQPLLV